MQPSAAQNTLNTCMQDNGLCDMHTPLGDIIHAKDEEKLIATLAPDMSAQLVRSIICLVYMNSHCVHIAWNDIKVRCLHAVLVRLHGICTRARLFDIMANDVSTKIAPRHVTPAPPIRSSRSQCVCSVL